MATVSSGLSVAPAVAPLRLRRFTVAEYQRLIDEGFFGSDERFELLDGLITQKMSRNPPHDASLDRARRRIERLLGPGWMLRVQSAIVTSDSQPEPDLAVVRGNEGDFDRQHPSASETVLVVEVANTSLADDSGIKLRTYAAAGISEYWIINIMARRVEVLTAPNGNSYGRRTVYTEADAVPLRMDAIQVGSVPVNELMPA